METKIYLYSLGAYRSASEKQKKVDWNLYYDLDLLPTEGLRKEFYAFLTERGKRISGSTLVHERDLYIRLCKFLKERQLKAESIQTLDLEIWLKKLRAWLLSRGEALTQQGMSVYGKEKVVPSAILTYFRKIYSFTECDNGGNEAQKDIWNLEKLDISYKANPIKNYKTVNFSKIWQPDIKEEVKKAVFQHLQEEAIASVSKELTAVRRFSQYLKEKSPAIESCADMNRETLEEYLVYLRTEDTGIKNFKGDLTRLRAVLETIGKICGYQHLESLFLNTDIPRMTKTELKSYSDAELKRLNAAIAGMDEQMCRVMVIHQMLGTRISDTLTLQTDCLYEQDGHPMIKIRQMKTNTYIKPISAEVSILIQKAIDYTKRKYGDTFYIFVDDSNPNRSLQYNTIQNRVMSMIQKEKLRDDRGELFGFGTHMFRHCYGIKLTEMHLDDWTIAKLLGHKSVKNVRFYRKMSHQILADETREIRDEMSRMIRANLKGWGKEYEQI